MSDHHELDADVHLEPQEAAPADTSGGADGPLMFVMDAALRELRAHAAEEPQHEIGGILVGSVTDGERPVVLVEAAIRGHNMAHTRGSVTFTHETWNEINTVKDSQYPELKIVGWYHSHPGFGLFLSGHDLFIHRNFFTAPWQVAIVADPLAKTWGCFTWQGQDLAQDSQVHTVAVQWSPDEAAVAARDAAAAQPPPVILPSPLPAARDRGVTWALGLLGLLLALLLGVALANYHDVNVLSGQVKALNQQVSGLAHDLTVVRDHVLDLSGPSETSMPTQPPSTATTEPSMPAPPAPTPAMTPAMPPPAPPAPGATP